MTTLRQGFVGFGGGLLAWLSVACGGTTLATREGPSDEPDELADVPCRAWEPGDAAWSSLPGPQPAALAGMRASASGRYLYAVGSWREAGNLRQQALRSRDLGETWCVVETPSDVTTLAPSPSSETVLYALSAPAAGEGAHLLRTSDGGATWEQSNTTLPEGVSGELAASAGSVDTVWFVAPDPLKQHALHYSQDAGETWSERSPPAFESFYGSVEDYSFGTVDGLAVDPTSSNRLLAWGTVTTATESESRPHWFSSEDAGDSWSELAGPVLSVGQTYLGNVSVTSDAGGQLFLTAEGAPQRSLDWGETWTELDALPAHGLTVGTLGGTEPGQFFAWSARGRGPFEVGGGLWRSVDGGAHWKLLGLPTDGQLVPVLAPAKDKLVGLTPLGISNTTDGGKTWRVGAVTPLPLHLAQPLAEGSKLWATDLRGWSQGPGLRSGDGGLTWSPTAEVSGQLLLDSSDPDVAFAGAVWGSDALQRTEDGGKTWTPIELPEARIAAAATCRDGSSCLYATLQRDIPNGRACSIIKSEDRGRTWSDEIAISHTLCGSEQTLTVMPDDPQHLLNACGTAVCESKDGGASWKEHGVSAERYVLAIVPLSDGVVLAATGGASALEPPVLVRSEDGGATWTEVLNVGAGRFFASAAAPNTVFLVSPVSNEPDAIYRSDDAGLTWQAIANDPDATPVLDVFSIADGADGGFVASTLHGLVQFR